MKRIKPNIQKFKFYQKVTVISQNNRKNKNSYFLKTFRRKKLKVTQKKLLQIDFQF